MADKISIEQYAQSLYEVISDTNPKDHDKVINNFIRILKENNDLGSYEKIIDAYENLIAIENTTAQIEITTANETSITPGIIKELNKFAKDNLKTKSEVNIKVDESIIGGVLIKVDDTLIDASLKTELNNLHSNLQK